ncbi:MAG: HU family DNA-binding protein [Promicromonosporaceae bacterium]|nr:HU family DNA-binding protein [Promicromonosporaceae bacterium]
MPLNKSDIVAEIAAKSGLTKADAEAALNAFADVLIESVGKGEPVKLTGLFSVERITRAARTGRNPRTGEKLEIPAGFGVKISAGALLKKAAVA